MSEKSVPLNVLVICGCPLTCFGIITVVGCGGSLILCGDTADATVARRLCAEKKPDLIVLDLAEHRGDGLTLLRDLGRLHPAARVLVVSDREDTDSMQRCFRAGARGYVSRRDEAAEVLVGLEMLRMGGLFASRRVSHLLLEQFAGGKMRGPARGPEGLSDRELAIFRRIGAGLGTSAVARELGVSVKTVETYRERIKEKLGLGNGEALKRCAVAWGRKKGRADNMASSARAK